MRRNKKVNVIPLALGISVLAALVCAIAAMKQKRS